MSDQAERMAKANQLVGEIASCGRRFFHAEGKPHGQFVLHPKKGVLWRDERAEVLLDIRDDKAAPRFSHGGGLKSFIGELRSWVLSGDPPPMASFGHHWAYPQADIERLRDVGREIGFLPREHEMDAGMALRTEEPVRPEGSRFRPGQSQSEVTVVMEWDSPEDGSCSVAVRGAMPKSTMREILGAIAKFEAIPEVTPSVGMRP